MISPHADPRVDAILAALDELVSELRAAGLTATRNPEELQPPSAIVAAPNFRGGTLGSITLEVPVYLVTNDLGQAGVDALVGMLPAAMEALRTRESSTTHYVSPLNPAGLPAYVLVATITIGG